MFELVVLVVAGTLTALVAGLFFGFSVAVNGALHQLKDLEYIRAMQAINRVILNPVFLLSFIGPVFLLPLATFFMRESSTQFALLLMAGIAYIFGTFGVTMTGNVPLNEKLMAFKAESADATAVTAARQAFESPWNRLHTVRTLASILATVLLFVACLQA